MRSNHVAQNLRDSRMLAVLLTPLGLFFGLWFSFSAIKGLIISEQNIVHRTKTLVEGENIVISTDAYQMEEMNEGKLIHLSDDAMVDEILRDSFFYITVVNVIKLQRIVEIYQWQEQQSQMSDDTIDYTYEQIWSEQLIDSSEFASSEEYHNPSILPITSQMIQAKRVKLGNFILSSNMTEQMNRYQRFPMTEYSFLQVRESLSSLFPYKEIHFENGKYYVGQNPAYPKIGDVRIKFQIVRPETISVIAKQTKSYLDPYQTQSGGEIELLEFGRVSATQMFSNARMRLFVQQLSHILLEFLLMFLGFYILFGAWWVSKNSLPILGKPAHLVGWLISVLIAIILTLIIIAMIWRNQNLVMSNTLLVIAAIFSYFFQFVRKPAQQKLIREEIVPIKRN